MVDDGAVRQAQDYLRSLASDSRNVSELLEIVYPSDDDEIPCDICDNVAVDAERPLLPGRNVSRD